MGRLKILFIKNRCEKIARHKARKKKRKPNKKSNKKIELSNSQLVLKKDNFYKKPKICNREKTVIEIPSRFNLINNPVESLNTLKEINYAFEQSKSKEINFDYSKCYDLGLDASVICDLLVSNGESYRKSCNKKVKLSGNMPQGYAAGEIFCSLPSRLSTESFILSILSTR